MVLKNYITRVDSQTPNNGGLASHCHERLYTLEIDEIEEEKGRIKEEKEIMALENAEEEGEEEKWSQGTTEL